MQTTNVVENRQSGQTTGASQRNAGERGENSPRRSITAEIPQAVGTQLQINGNVSHSQFRQATTNVPQVPMTFRTTTKDPQGTQRTSTTSSAGSSQRKRSRLGEEGGLGPIQNLSKLQESINAMNGHIENLQKNGQKGNTGLIRIQMTDCMREIMAEVTNIMTKMVNVQDLQLGYLKAEKQLKDKIICLQEDNTNIKQQVVDLQLKIINKEQEEKVEVPPTYAQMVHKNIATSIIAGRQLPLPQVPQSVRHAPSECIILCKSEKKGEMKTKAEQEEFRKEVKDSLNVEEQKSISAIRPTRYGGYTIIFYNEKLRDQVYKKLRIKEEESGIDECESKMVAPPKRVAKVVCKEVPSDLSIEQIKKDMYDKHNPILQRLNTAQRMGNIYRTRLGLIFELTSYEMAAIQSQGWKISCDLRRELRVEEFISLQQCYACAKFGHSALECKSTEEVCRLCGKTGHAGKDCEEKNNKDAWRCANCYRMNQVKSLNLDIKHAAAQLHKCPVAQQQKNIRKLQLASTGVFTTPISKGDGLLNAKPSDTVPKRSTNGPQRPNVQNESRRKNRSRSITKNRNLAPQNLLQRTVEGTQRMHQYGNEGEIEEGNPCVQRPIRIPRPQTDDGWQTVRTRKQKGSDSSEGGRRSMIQREQSQNGEMEVEEEAELKTMDDALVDDDDIE